MKKLLLILSIAFSYASQGQTIELNHSQLVGQFATASFNVNKNIAIGSGYPLQKQEVKTIPIFVTIAETIGKGITKSYISSNLGYLTESGVFVRFNVGVARSGLYSQIGVLAQEYNKKMGYGFCINFGFKF